VADPVSKAVFRTPEGGWRVSRSRVSLDSVIHEYRNGALPETIVASFPSLSLEQVRGAIDFYLQNRDEIDRYLAEQQKLWDRLRQASEAEHNPVVERIRAKRQVPSE
jgi:uncharacterized protein (DUF433 family)